MPSDTQPCRHSQHMYGEVSLPASCIYSDAHLTSCGCCCAAYRFTASGRPCTLQSDACTRGCSALLCLLTYLLAFFAVPLVTLLREVIHAPAVRRLVVQHALRRQTVPARTPGFLPQVQRSSSLSVLNACSIVVQNVLRGQHIPDRTPGFLPQNRDF